MTEPDPQAEPKAESRFRRHGRIAREIYAHPASAGHYLRSGLVSAWASHGAGFYGLGWVCTFLALEFNLLTGELAESSGVGDFVSSQLIEYVLRFGVMSFINGLLASIWPVYLFEWLGVWAIAALAAGYFAFERFVRPGVEIWAPELKAARLARENANAEKKSKKTAKKHGRKDGDGNVPGET